MQLNFCSLTAVSSLHTHLEYFIVYNLNYDGVSDSLYMW